MPKERTNFSYPASNSCSLSVWLCGGSRTVLLAPQEEYFVCVCVSPMPSKGKPEKGKGKSSL